jgi:hypothetical protein
MRRPRGFVAEGRSPAEGPRALLGDAEWSNTRSYHTARCGGVATDAKRGENRPPFVGHWLAVSRANEQILRAAYESAARMHGPDFDFLDPEELIDAGDDVVIAVLQLSGRIRGSGEEVKMPETHVWTMRDGKGVDCREYPTKAEALKALGLQE